MGYTVQSFPGQKSYALGFPSEATRPPRPCCDRIQGQLFPCLQHIGLVRSKVNQVLFSSLAFSLLWLIVPFSGIQSTAAFLAKILFLLCFLLFSHSSSWQIWSEQQGRRRGPRWANRRAASSDSIEHSEAILLCPAMVLLVRHLSGHIDSILERTEHNTAPSNATPFIRIKRRTKGSFSGILYIYREFVVGLKQFWCLRTNPSSW